MPKLCLNCAQIVPNFPLTGIGPFEFRTAFRQGGHSFSRHTFRAPADARHNETRSQKVGAGLS